MPPSSTFDTDLARHIEARRAELTAELAKLDQIAAILNGAAPTAASPFPAASSPTVETLILEAASRRAGVRSGEIIDYVRAARPSAAKSSIYTCAYRLKKAGRLIKRDGRFFESDPMSLPVSAPTSAAA